MLIISYLHSKPLNTTVVLIKISAKLVTKSLICKYFHAYLSLPPAHVAHNQKQTAEFQTVISDKK